MQPDAGQNATAKGAPDRSHKGSLMPEMTFSDPEGRKLRLADLKGQPVLINLWATWCAGCLAELPQLNKLAASGFRVVTISQDMQQLERVPEFLRARGGPDLEAWLDPQSELSFHYGSGALPTTLLYDSAGREVWRVVGERDWLDKQSQQLLAEAE